MFTVIIAEKEHIDRIREYDIFLSPFADHRHIALCRWYPEKDTLAEAVPELRETVAREKTWRALILTTGEACRTAIPLTWCRLSRRRRSGRSRWRNICPGCVR